MLFVVAGSSLQNMKGYIWSSPHTSLDSGSFYVSIDDNGSLAVYREFDGKDEHMGNVFEEFKEKFRYPSTTRAAIAFKMAQKWMKKAVTKMHCNKAGDICVWSSTFGSCNNGVRSLVKTVRELKHCTETVLDNVVKFVEEGGEDDIDFIDTATRIVEKAGRRFASVFMISLKKGIYEGKIASSVLREVMHDKFKHFKRKAQKGHTRNHKRNKY